jgi:hypothetical protein
MILMAGQFLLLAAIAIVGPMVRTGFAPLTGRLLATLCFLYAALAVRRGALDLPGRRHLGPRVLKPGEDLSA